MRQYITAETECPIYEKRGHEGVLCHEFRLGRAKLHITQLISEDVYERRPDDGVYATGIEDDAG